MTKQYKLGPAAQIPFGEGRNFLVEGRRIAVFRTRDDAVFATQASCPHRQGPLADGLLGGTTLVCPLHEWSFDLTSGKVLNGSCGIAVYAVTRGEGDELQIALPAEDARVSTAEIEPAEAGVDAED